MFFLIVSCFFILIIIFWIENYHSLFIPVKSFHCFFHSCFSSLWHFHFSFLCFENGPWSLELPPGFFSRTLFVSFHFVSFLYCFGYFSLLCLENCHWKLSKGNFFEPFSFFFGFFFVLVIFPPLPSKLTLEIVKRNFSRTLFVFFRFFSCPFSFSFFF